MSRWTIPVAFRSRSQPIAAVGVDARELGDADDVAVAREVVLVAMAEWGARTAGDLLDALEALGVDGRRRVLEAARASAGLPATATVEVRDALRAMTSPSPTPRTCAVDGCDAWPTSSPGGGIAYPNVKRWHCRAHEHLAAADDLAPRESLMEVTPSGALRELDPGDDERESRERARVEAREQERRLDANDFAAARRAERERAERESPEAVRQRAYGPLAAAARDREEPTP